MDLEDHSLVQKFLLERSESSFRKLYRNKTPRLYMIALRLSGNDIEIAEELLQEMWIRAIQKLHSFGWKSSLLTWLTGILINLNRERYRNRVHEKITEDLTAENVSSSKSIDAMDLEKAIASLPPGYRDILILHDVEGYKHKEIAEMMGIEEGTSKSQLFNARRAVRKYLST